ncbi:MAG: diacylglycerol kinase family protein [Cellvibrionaceae bacterium]|nr:diacylglycerol kinase family protein [Cellvibrionaceae bacterium]MCV6625222.1 diacylglycerol kinase family protein [Cellvibrionaceae bacterium]
MSKHILIICNPISGHSDKTWLEQLQQSLTTAGHLLQRYDTQQQGDATSFLQSQTWQAQLILIAGGDGTVNEVIQGLNPDQLASTKLLVLASGTANVLARELGLNGLAQMRQIDKICQLCAAALRGENIRQMHIPATTDKPMLLMAGAGFDAWVVKTVSPKLKARAGKFAYVVSMLKQLPRAGQHQLSFRVDGGPRQHCKAIIISNGQLYAGPYRLCPQGDISHPQLVATVFNGGPWRLLLSLLAMPFGMMGRSPGMRQLTVQRLDIDSPKGCSEPVEIDGDYAAELPFSVYCTNQFAQFVHNSKP